MSRGGIWRTLEIDRTEDTGAIRRAYAKALRAMDPDADPQGFARLRQARDQALALARRAGEQQSSGPPDDDLIEASGPLAPPDILVPMPERVALSATAADCPMATGTIVAAPASQPDEPFRLNVAQPDTGDGNVIPIDRDAVTLAPPVLDGVKGGDIVTGRQSEEERFDDVYRAVVALLHPPGVIENQWLSDEDDAKLVALVETLLTDPRLEQVAFSADAERWFGDTLASAIPRSDPVLHRIAERFGWLHEAGHISQSPAATRIAERTRSLAFVTLVQQPTHQYHSIWKELTKPAREKSRRAFWLGKSSVRSFIGKVRRDYPDAEAYFDPFRVALWENTPSGPGWGGWAFGIFILAKLLVGLMSYGSQPAAPPSPTAFIAPVSPPIADRDANINLALLTLADGFTVDRVKAENPELYASLSQRWTDAKRGEMPISQFIAETQSFLFDRFRAAFPHGEYNTLEAWQKFKLAQMDHIIAGGEEPCRMYLEATTESKEDLSDTERQRRRRLMAAIIIADHHPERAPPPLLHTFTIPGDVVRTVERETGYSNAIVSSAFRNKGKPEVRCRVRRALLAAALNLPKASGLTLLRAL